MNRSTMRIREVRESTKTDTAMLKRRLHCLEVREVVVREVALVDERTDE